MLVRLMPPIRLPNVDDADIWHEVYNCLRPLIIRVRLRHSPDVSGLRFPIAAHLPHSLKSSASPRSTRSHFSRELWCRPRQ